MATSTFQRLARLRVASAKIVAFFYGLRLAKVNLACVAVIFRVTNAVCPWFCIAFIVRAAEHPFAWWQDAISATVTVFADTAAFMADAVVSTIHSETSIWTPLIPDIDIITCARAVELELGTALLAGSTGVQAVGASVATVLHVRCLSTVIGQTRAGAIKAENVCATGTRGSTLDTGATYVIFLCRVFLFDALSHRSVWRGDEGP